MADSHSTRILFRVAWASWPKRGSFRIVSVEQARAETGLTLEQLLELHGVERLTRVRADGGREEALRMPIELPSIVPSAAGS